MNVDVEYPNARRIIPQEKREEPAASALTGSTLTIDSWHLKELLTDVVSKQTGHKVTDVQFNTGATSGVLYTEPEGVFQSVTLTLGNKL
jgi:hypothetical protein